MRKMFVFCTLLVLWLYLYEHNVRASDVGWMQKGVRAWYFGAVGSTTASDAEEAYLFSSVNGTDVQVIKHSGIVHWGTTNSPETGTYSFLDKGPFWIHPQVLQTLQSGDTWKGQVIATVLRESHTYSSFKGQFSFPYLLLPIKTLFDLKAQRDLVKIVYYISGYSTGIAYFDADTGLLLLYETSDGFVTIFFLLSEINYDFATHRAFDEDNGPHTGFQSFVLEQQITPLGYALMQSSVESRYGSSVQMWTSISECGTTCSAPPFQSYCFFGSIPVLRYIDMTQASDYPPEQWDTHGQYLWWWLPPDALQDSTINVFNASLERTSADPYTFTAIQQQTDFYFSKMWFDNDGYLTQFSAKDSTTGLDIDPELGPLHNKDIRVDGLDYYRNNMGNATVEILRAEVVLDFGAGTGIWTRYNNASWSKLHNLNSEIITTGDLDGNGADECIIDFGPGIGVYVLYNNTTWTKLHSQSPEIIATGDLDGNGKDEIIIDFGAGTGIWIRYNNSTWTKLHSLSPEIITTGDLDGNGEDDCVIDFGAGIGVYVYYNNSTWTKLHNLSPKIISTGDLDGSGQDDCIVDFGSGIGVYVLYNNTTWTKLHSLSAEIIATGDLDGNGEDECIMDFGAGTGLCVRYNNATWSKLHNLSPEIIETGDLDSNGKDEIIIDFGSGIGTYVRYNNATWTKLHSLSPESITTGNLDNN